MYRGPVNIQVGHFSYFPSVSLILRRLQQIEKSLYYITIGLLCRLYRNYAHATISAQVIEKTMKTRIIQLLTTNPMVQSRLFITRGIGLTYCTRVIIAFDYLSIVYLSLADVKSELKLRNICLNTSFKICLIQYTTDR